MHGACMDYLNRGYVRHMEVSVNNTRYISYNHKEKRIERQMRSRFVQQ